MTTDVGGPRAQRFQYKGETYIIPEDCLSGHVFKKLGKWCEDRLSAKSFEHARQAREMKDVSTEDANIHMILCYRYVDTIPDFQDMITAIDHPSGMALVLESIEGIDGKMALEIAFNSQSLNLREKIRQAAGIDKLKNSDGPSGSETGQNGQDQGRKSRPTTPGAVPKDF